MPASMQRSLSRVAAIAAEAGYGLADLEPVFTVGQSDFYIVVSRDTPADVVQAWQAGLDRLKADGTLARIRRKYLPAGGPREAPGR